MRQNELMEILAQAGPRGKEIAGAIGRRRSVEIHLHITGPIIIGSELAQAVMPLLIEAGSRPEEVTAEAPAE